MKQVITSGVDSEYVLAGLSAYLRERGHEVIEIDFGNFTGDPKKLLDSFPKNEVIYITSAHTNLTLRVASTIAPKFAAHYTNYLAPIEIIPYLQPYKSIYIPHDLLTPYGDTNLDEYRFLDIYDEILAPQNSRSLQAMLPVSTRVHEAGWIKYTKGKCNPEKNLTHVAKVTLFISMIEHLRNKYGTEGLINYLTPFFTNSFSIKLPQWNNISEIEKAIRNVGNIEVIPSNTDTTSVILNADVVICNGASSIHAEATLLGRPTICLLDNEGISMSDQIKKLSPYSSIYLHDYRQRLPISNTLLTQARKSIREPLLRPFRYELVEEIINS